MARSIDECALKNPHPAAVRDNRQHTPPHGDELRITMTMDEAPGFERNYFRRPANAPISARRSHTRLIVITGLVVVVTATVLGLLYRR